MNNKRVSFGYEDTDKKIEIDLYGLVFEIKNIDNVEELENLDENDSNEIEAQIDKILGKGAVEKINKKRINDGYSEMTLDVELNVIGCIMSAYAETMIKNPINKVTNTVEKINRDMNNFSGTNREQRRNYNRNQYRGNRRNYRRY